MMSTDLLYFIVPCYNEEAVLPETSKRLKKKMTELIAAGKVSPESRICFVNDGSKDSTWQIISELHDSDPVFSGINLSRNRGHQNALLAGLMTVKDFCDLTISMDADLQDDIEVCDQMIDKYHAGKDIVYGVRSARALDSRFKKSTAQSFYKMMNRMGAETVYNHADYRLMSKRAMNALSGFREVNLFLRGIVPLIGFPTDVVYYERAERFAGESKYPLKKMISFAIDGLTSFSSKLLELIARTGGVIFLAGAVLLIVEIIRWAVGQAVPGWAFPTISIWTVGGLILLAVGIVGVYTGKTYMESKERPRYIVERFLDRDHGFIS